MGRRMAAVGFHARIHAREGTNGIGSVTHGCAMRGTLLWLTKTDDGALSKAAVQLPRPGIFAQNKRPLMVQVKNPHKPRE